MAAVADRLAAVGLALPPPPEVLGNYLPARRVGVLVFTAGQLPLVDGSPMRTGSVGRDVDVPEAADCAERAALLCLAAASTVCDLDDVTCVVKLTGYVASADGFTRQPEVVNSASNVMAVAFGDAGAHARAAVGVASLPLGAPVEIEIVLALREG